MGYISRLENGIVAPPAEHEKVVALAEALEIEKGTPKWNEFIDMVAVARNEVPEDLRSNEVIMKILPAFYRGARKKILSKEEIEKLIEFFEEAGRGQLRNSCNKSISIMKYSA